MGSSARLAEQMAALAELGFSPAQISPFEVDSVSLRDGRRKVTCSQPSMGTLVTLTILADSADRAQEAAGRAFREMDRVVDLLNRYDPDSALFSLNAEGALQGPPPELSTVLEGSLRIHELSRGAFDPTVQPLVDLFRMRSLQSSCPQGADDAEVREALALVDSGSVVQTPRSIRLEREGMGVTLDGIAKGYVVDRMTQILEDHGLVDFLVNAGGDIRASGHREDGAAWRVGVQDPEKRDNFPDVIALTGGAVATSGSYEIFYDPDRTHHHIVSGRTGDSPFISQSVSVIAPTTMAADALATSVFVMDPGRGVAFIDSLPDCACLVVDHAGRHHASRGWRSAAGYHHRKAGST